MARVTLTSAGEDVTVGGSDVQVVGTTSANEIITVISGNIRLDPSFNQGGDTVVLPGAASSYSAYLVGTEVVFVRNDGAVTLRIPVGTAGTEIQFDGGDSRTLQINTTTGTIQLEGQNISGTAAAPTPITGGGVVTPTNGYDVVNTTTAVTEGDSGNRQLVYTIELDRAVTAADGPVTLNFRTLNGTATSADDYVAAAGQVTFGVGQRFATVTVQVNGDLRQEADETLQLELTGAALRNGAELLNGVILNDDVVTNLTSGSDAVNGTANNDIFLAANRNLGAGDRLTDTNVGDTDRLQVAIDGSIGANGNFGGFELVNIEALEVTNDSGNNDVRFDLSGSTGLTSASSVNSANSITFDQLRSTQTAIGLTRITGLDADVTAIFQAAATQGATTNVTVVATDSVSDVLRLQTAGDLAGATGTGIETVTIQAIGTSSIETLDTALTNLVINGGGSFAIDNALRTSVRNIDATLANNVDLDFSANNVGVTVLGGSGDNVLAAGAGNDTITTQGGDDSITDTGGNLTANTGAGDDTVVLAANTFDLNDTITLGGDAGDTLVINELLVDADLTNVEGATNLTINATGAAVIGAQAIDADIRRVNLNVNAAGNDSLDATGVTTGLTVDLGAFGGEDTVLFGTGNDTLITSSLTDGDNLVGGAGSDTLNILDGANTVTAASLFRGFETITISSDGDGDDQSITIDNGNAPTGNGVLTVNASALVATTDEDDADADEVLTFDASAVTAFSINVTGGAAGDIINTNNTLADSVFGGAGNDEITAGATAAGAGDIVRGEAGDDTITLGAGNNDVDGGDDDDTIIIGAGAGNNNVRGSAGDDRVEILAGADFNATDIIDGGVGGTDTISVVGTQIDVNFTGATNFEVIEGRAGAASNITLGAQLTEAGITRVNLLNTGADTLAVAAGYTNSLTVDARAGGDDVITTGGGDDLIITGIGDNSITTGAGADRIRVSGGELTAADTIVAGAGTDTVELDVSGTGAAALGPVTAVVNLNNVTGVERFAVIGGGDRGAGIDADASTITFQNGNFAEATRINVDATGLTDAADSLTVNLDAVTDPDAIFVVTGSDTATTIVRRTGTSVAGVEFTGGAGVDQLVIDGNTATAELVFDGRGGTDRIVQAGGTLSDNVFANFNNVEVLAAATGQVLNASLGFEAFDADLVRIEGSAGNDTVTLTSGFTGPLTVVIGGGDDSINGGNSTASLTFVATASGLTAADVLTGGRGQADVLNITAGGSSNVDGVTRVETININNSTAAVNPTETSVIDLGTLNDTQVDGGRLTINYNNSAVGDTLSLTTNAASTANLTVNAGVNADTITTGAGADIVNGLAGDDVINAGAGADLVNGGEGADTINGQAGADTINGDAGADSLFGGDGNDTINGGIGNDTLVGGIGADRLTGGDGADVFDFNELNDSRNTTTAAGPVNDRDVITDFTSGVDRIDLSDILALSGETSIRFNGNFNDFGSAQAAVGTGAGDTALDVVFVRNLEIDGVIRSVLFVDIDNNGQLGGDDLQIILEGVTSLTSVDVGGPAPTTFAPAAEFSALRFDGGFENHQFA
ncbi:beta strand repeat-containing protein [Sphingomonas sp. LHG3443-2]|uniref:beta strand repeat-containing protein n=1 Tax=Sphingomonas sp. LHG3443-2 TaxID=2804639 RepID=UPI003CF75FF6